MTTAKTIKVGADITARKNHSDKWEIKHPGRDGKMTRWYSTGISGTERDIRSHLKERKVEDIVALGQRGALSDKVLAQFQHGSPKSAKLAEVHQPWLDWLRKIGESPATIQQYNTYFKLWLRTMRLDDTPVAKIGFDHLFPFVNPADSQIKKTTRSARLHMSRSLFKYLVAQGYCSGNPSKLVAVNMDMLSHAQKERKRVETYSLEAVQRLVAFADEEIRHIEQLIRTGASDPRIRKPESRLAWMHFWRFAVIASYEVGMRLGDLCDLEWSSFSTKGHVVVWTGKREKRISLPLDEFAPWLTTAIGQIPCEDLGHCFPDIHQVHLNSRSTISVYFGKLCAQAGVKPRTFHALRHTAIQRMQREGRTLQSIGQLVAHANTSTTEGYL